MPIIPVVINNLGGKDIHACIPTLGTKVILRNQACTGLWPALAWFKMANLCYRFILPTASYVSVIMIRVAFWGAFALLASLSYSYYLLYSKKTLVVKKLWRITAICQVFLPIFTSSITFPMQMDFNLCNFFPPNFLQPSFAKLFTAKVFYYTVYCYLFLLLHMSLITLLTSSNFVWLHKFM